MNGIMKNVYNNIHTVKNIREKLIEYLYNNILNNHFDLLAEIGSLYSNNNISKMDSEGRRRVLILTDNINTYSVVMAFGNNIKMNNHLLYKVNKSEYLKLRIGWFVESILSKTIQATTCIHIDTVQDGERLYSILLEYIYSMYTLDEIHNNMADRGWNLIVENNTNVSHLRSYREGPITKYNVINKKWYLEPLNNESTE